MKYRDLLTYDKIFLIELIVYVVLGIVWIAPFKSVFKGVGQADPDADADSDPDSDDK